ncbi:mechanosensitive ion channel family protein [Streptomyces sp. NPDC048340]|uniref:mechanosensitive ion channel family protein n=1 Tax=Streptomyces sp. NPDC048340 TaxID=3365537 RepID=UPI0037101044
MPWPAALLPLAADTPDATDTLRETHQNVTNAASFIEENWAGWLYLGLRILLIVVIAAALRSVVRKSLTKLITRMNRSAEAVEGTALGGLLVNAERRRQRSEAIGSVLRSVASFLILGTAGLMVLGALDINLGPLLASAGVAGVAIGFGARNLVTDFLSGVFMILEDQYGVGDKIDAGVASGEVVEVGLRVTKLRGDNGEIWYVRNGEIKRIGNLSQGWATAGVAVQVKPTESLAHIREVVQEVADGLAKESPWDERLWGPVEVLGLDEVLLASMTVKVSAKTMPGQQFAVERELRWRIKEAFDTAGIRIIGGAPAVDEAEDAAPADPAAAVAPPSALANPSSPQSLAATPIPAAQIPPPAAAGPRISK